jgi:hypothetical protein
MQNEKLSQLADEINKDVAYIEEKTNWVLDALNTVAPVVAAKILKIAAARVDFELHLRSEMKFEVPAEFASATNVDVSDVFTRILEQRKERVAPGQADGDLECAGYFFDAVLIVIQHQRELQEQNRKRAAEELN